MTALRLALLAACCAVAASAAPLTPEELARVKADEAARVAAIEKVYGAVVAIYGQNVARGGGSGVLFHPDGFALTNFHVVRAAGRKGKAGLADGKLYDWELYGIDPGGDLAVIRLKAPSPAEAGLGAREARGKKPFPAAQLGDSNAVRVGDWAMAMGNPFNLAEDQKPTVTLGIVSGVERFQPGQGGGRTLVYGNCLQIDSSINPGNSGGPLFDLGGHVIGINGRGSFEERGRVNVGLGYAVSVEQAKNFLPDLLATKACEHATLDAVFYENEGKVRCNAINQDAAIARLGMRLNDELIAFDGVPIRTTNQFLNLISTYPAGWPVSVTFRRDGEERTVWLRLRKLPYAPQRRPRPQPRIQPRIVPPRKDDEKKPEDSKGEGGKKEERPRPTVRRAPRLPPMKPGEISNKKLNREACAWLVGRWAASLRKGQTAEAVKALEWEETVLEEGEVAGRQRVVLALDGRFRVDVVEGYDGAPKGAAWGFDGTRAWRQEPGEAKPVEPKPEPLESAAWRTLAALRGKDPLKAFKHVELEGGDRAQGQRAFRVRFETKAGHKYLLWFSLFGPDGALEPRLLKAAHEGHREHGGGITLADYRPVGGLLVPHRRRSVSGLDERVAREFVAASIRCLDAVPEAKLQPPVAAKE